MRTTTEHPLAAGTGDSLLVQALSGNQPACTPVWFMRQAGRSLPEYRKSRAGTDMLEACLTPELTAEITLQPVRRHGVDAAIFFSDIVVPLRLLGLPVSIVPGRGPVFEHGLTSAAEVKALVSRPTEQLLEAAPITRAVQLVCQQLAELSNQRNQSLPLIGFAGAPFTVASYLIEGGPSKDHLAARRMMKGDPQSWRLLLGWLAEVCGNFLLAQVRAGASVVQLFDSWAGALSRESYRHQVQWASQQTLAPIADITIADRPVPRIHFGVGTQHLLDLMAEVNNTALGIDYRTDLGAAIKAIPTGMPVQGNLDPADLFVASPTLLRTRVHSILEQGLAAPGHVFNLGHGVPQEADPDVLTEVVRLVHQWAPEQVAHE
jgi:uroporphyrinogen decarboxylase